MKQAGDGQLIYMQMESTANPSHVKLVYAPSILLSER